MFSGEVHKPGCHHTAGRWTGIAVWIWTISLGLGIRVDKSSTTGSLRTEGILPPGEPFTYLYHRSRAGSFRS